MAVRRALAMKVVEVFFEGNLRASATAVLFFPLLGDKQPLRGPPLSLSPGPGVKCGADPQPTRDEEGKRLELELNFILGVRVT